jgi:hypothetical protein
VRGARKCGQGAALAGTETTLTGADRNTPRATEPYQSCSSSECLRLAHHDEVEVTLVREACQVGVRAATRGKYAQFERRLVGWRRALQVAQERPFGLARQMVLALRRSEAEPLVYLCR